MRETISHQLNPFTCRSSARGFDADKAAAALTEANGDVVDAAHADGGDDSDASVEY